MNDTSKQAHELGVCPTSCPVERLEALRLELHDEAAMSARIVQVFGRTELRQVRKVNELARRVAVLEAEVQA